MVMILLICLHIFSLFVCTYVCVCIHMCTCAIVCLRRSVVNSWESVLFLFTMWVLEIELRSSDSATSALALSTSHLPYQRLKFVLYLLLLFLYLVIITFFLLFNVIRGFPTLFFPKRQIWVVLTVYFFLHWFIFYYDFCSYLFHTILWAPIPRYGCTNRKLGTIS